MIVHSLAHVDIHSRLILNLPLFIHSQRQFTLNLQQFTRSQRLFNLTQHSLTLRRAIQRQRRLIKRLLSAQRVQHRNLMALA